MHNGNPTSAVSGIRTSVTKDSVTISWNELTSAASYGYSDITKYTVKDRTGTEVTYDTKSTSYTITGTPAGTQRTFVITATNFYGEGPATAAFHDTPEGTPDQMDPPGISQSGADVTVTWTAPADNG